MSIQLSGADIVDLAVQTEVRGERFYRQAADAADRPEARELFVYLANEEVRHKQVFEGLASAITVTEVDPTTWEEAMAYIEATVDREFFDPEAPIRTVAVAQDVGGMLRQAIQFEQQTLLFFHTLRDLVRKPTVPIIDGIIKEERSHVRRLSAMLATA